MPNHLPTSVGGGYNRGTSSAPSWQPLAPDSMCAICRRISALYQSKSDIGGIGHDGFASSSQLLRTKDTLRSQLSGGANGRWPWAHRFGWCSRRPPRRRTVPAPSAADLSASAPRCFAHRAQSSASMWARTARWSRNARAVAQTRRSGRRTLPRRCSTCVNDGWGITQRSQSSSRSARVSFPTCP